MDLPIGYVQKEKKVCFKTDCTKIATYGFERNIPITCKTHVYGNMKDVIHIFCVLCNEKRPNFGIDKATHCATCKTSEMRAFHKMCIGCNKKVPKYGIDKATHCASCRTDNMRSFQNMCIVCHKIVPAFGFDKATHCLHCKEISMKRVSSDYCDVCKERRANFGIDKPTHCSSCRTVDMRSFHKMCIVCSKTVPSFGTDKATHCSQCRTPQMKSFNRLCIACNVKIPTFGETTRTHCSMCKDSSMTRIRNDMCCECNNVRANFGTTKPTHCSSCKKPNMKAFYNLCTMCNLTLPSYGYDKPTHCYGCKNSLMKNFGKMCVTCKNVSPTYNFPGQKPMYCFSCRQPQMVDVVHPTCKNGWCENRSQTKYNNSCFRCFVHENPDHQFAKNYLAKEKHVIEFIKDKFASNHEVHFQKKIDGGCSKRRPDAYIDLHTHTLIIECDENQHKNYDTTCEIARINELFTDLGDRPIIFIRFNPDSYKDADGKTVKSCFSYHKTTGLAYINDKKKWTERLTTLETTIRKHIANIPIETKFEYLFFD